MFSSYSSSDDAETREVEMGVDGLQRVVGPLDQVQPHRQRRVPLRQLQPHPEPGAARLRHHPEHVRPLARPAVLDRRNRVDETFHRALVVEGAEQDAAALDRDDQHRRRYDIFGVGVAPDDALEVGDLAAVVDGRQGADDHPGGQVSVRPPRTCRWMWKTVCPASALQLNTVR